MPINNIQPLKGLNRMSLYDLSDRERQQWYKANEHILSKYNPYQRDDIAQQLYKDQLFFQKFGKEEFDKTFNVPGGAEWRNQQLERRLVKEAIKNTFKPAEEFVTNIDTGVPYMRPDGTPMKLVRDKKDVNISNEEYRKILEMDTQGQKEILEAYANGKWKPGGQIKNENVFSIYAKAAARTTSDMLKPIIGEKAAGVVGAVGEAVSIPGLIGHGRHQYKQTKNQDILDKLYDESSHRIAESEEVSKKKSEAYLNNSIVGGTDEETKKIFAKTIMPDYENGNLGIPTYAAYFNDYQVRKEVKDLSIDRMREIIATKYAMEQAGIPKAQVRDMLERDAQKYVADNTGAWTKTAKFYNDMLIAASSYTADKWNGIKNSYYAYEDYWDGGVNVWVDDEGNIVGEKDHPEIMQQQNYKVSYDKNGNAIVNSRYVDKDGKLHPLHKEKISRSALLYMGRESDGDNVGGKLQSWADPEKWTKAEQYGVWTQDQIDKWDKIGASPYAMTWDPDEGSHIMYDSFKMMSFGLADQAMMFIPGGAGMAAKAITSTNKLATASKATLDFISKMGSASRTGQILNNAAASLGIGFAYARGNAYEKFSEELTKQEEALRMKSEADLSERYANDKEYKESIDNRIAKVKQSIIDNTITENTRQLESWSAVIDMNLLEQQAEYQAYAQVQEGELQKQMQINKDTPEFQKLHENAVNTVAYTSNLMAATDAAKYFALGAWGYRRYLYENPTGLFKKTGKTVKDAFKGTKSALKHVKEAKNTEGKLRLSTVVGKEFTGLKNQAKQLGKVSLSQFGGGAWTNGTDDMQVDGVQQIEEDALRQMYDFYVSGEPIADVYGGLDYVSSFMTGMGRSLGQGTTWNAALVGGLGSMISGNLNFANIASLATKQGRDAFREQYGKRYQRDSEGYLKYEEKPVLDDNGQPVKDQNGNVVTKRVPVTENINWKQNIGERLGFFLQNGVLNTYYGNKQAAMAKVDRVQAANQLLDEWGDFVDLEDYLSANAAGENVESEREKRTSSLLKALRLARALDQIGKTEEGKRDVEDPLLKSSLVKQAKEFIEKANSMEVYDTGVNIGQFSNEEAENMLKEWYSRHPQEVRSQSKDVDVLRSIKENAQELTDAMKSYDEASKHVERSERQSNKTFSTHVKNKMVEDKVLYNHWKNRFDKMRREVNDNSAADRALSTEEFIASVGGLGNAESLVQIYDASLARMQMQDKPEIDKKVEESDKRLEAARNRYSNAKTTDEREQARVEVEQAYAQHDSNLANQEYVDGLISRVQEKRDQAYNAMEESASSYASELQDTIGHLSDKKQKDAVNLARRIFTTRNQIEDIKKGRKASDNKITAKENRNIKRLRRQEQADRKQLINATQMSDSQMNRFIERVGELNNINAQGRVLTTDEIMSLDPVTRSKMLDVNNRRLYSMAQLKEIDKLIGELNMRDPSILEKLHDIARLHQQMDMVMDSYKRLSQHPEGAALAIETDRRIAADAAYKLIDRRFAKDVANFIEEFDDKIIVNSTDESNDIVSALSKYRDRLLNMAGLVRFLETKAQLDEQIRNRGGKPSVTQRDKDNAIFQLLRTLNSRILDILAEEHLIDNHITELNKARRWVAVVEDIASVLDNQIMDATRKENLERHIFGLTFPCDDKESVMRVLEEEANNPTKPDFVADVLNLLDDLEELGHLRDATIVKLNAEKYKDAFKQKSEAQLKKNKDTADKAFAESQQDDLEDFIANLDEPTRKAIESILENSKNRKLNESGSRYVIDGKDYARVTSVKHLLKGSTLEKFDENSPWSLPSTSIGNSLDEFGRDVFNGIYDNMTEEERLQEFEKRYSNSTANNYEHVFQALKDFQKKLRDKNQRIIKLGNSADNQGSAVAAGTITLTMPDGTEKEVRIAGSLDVLAIDNKGNLHIYDFKTYRSGTLNITDAVSKGYDRQLSMYAKLLEEEYGLKVASINIIPVKATYPEPKGIKKFGRLIKTGAEYKKNSSSSSQLSVKEKGSKSFRDYKEANFQVGNVFGLIRLGEDGLTIDYTSLNNEYRAEVDKLPVEIGEETTQTPPPIPATETTQTQQKVEQEGESNGVHHEIDFGEETKQPEAQEEKVEPEITQTDTEIEADWGTEEAKAEPETEQPETEQPEAKQEAQKPQEQEEQESWPTFTEIKTSGTKDGKTVYGGYKVEMDDEGFLHVIFNKGNVAAKRGVSLKEINATKEDVFGKRENYDSPAEWDEIPVNEKIGIVSLSVSPNGYVIIGTLYDIIKGAVAAQMLDKAFPELREYMNRFAVNLSEDVTQETSPEVEQPAPEVTEKDGIKIHEENDAVWVESSEGNIQEAEASEKFNKGNTEGQTLDDANLEDTALVPASQAENQTVNTDDTRILPVTGNSIPYYWNTQDSPLAQHGEIVTQVTRREDEKRDNNEPINENDTLHVIKRFLDSSGTKLQDIIDEELAPIFMNNPETPIKFMAINWVSKEFSPHDKVLSETPFLVIDYTADVKRVHGDGKNGRKNNGGVVTVDSKEYLIIGTMGYGSKISKDFSRRQALWNSMFGRIPGATGFIKKQAANFFMNPENNGERFYVVENENGEFYSTTIKEGSITPGWYVKAFEGQNPNRTVSISYLLRDPDKLGTNPLGLKWETLAFGIAEYQQPWYTIDERAVMHPGDLVKNAGTTFVLIPAGNGKYAPVAIQPTMLSELKENSPLEQKIDKLLDDLLARNYNDRLAALKKLYTYIYLNSDKSVGKKNILLGKDNTEKANMISISIDGKVENEFHLDADDFNRQDFKDYIKNEMNPRINITPAILTNLEELKAYDASGALQTDVMMLRTMGSNFEIWPISADNKVLKPEKPAEQHPVETERNRGIQIPYTGQFYTRNTEGLYRDRDGKEVTDAALIEDLEINRRIIESGIQPEVTDGRRLRYILDQSVENPLVVDIDRNSHKVTKLSTEDAVAFIQETIAKREQEARDKAAKEAMSKDKEINKMIDQANPSKPDIIQQEREKGLEDIEQAAYNRVINNIREDDANTIRNAITRMEGIINNPAASLEQKAELKGYVRAYHEELERRQQPEKKSETPKQSEIKSINQTQSSGTITFQRLIGNRENLNRLMQILRNMPNAPRKISDLAEYLRGKNMEVDAIGNTEDDINAWFKTLKNCR